MFVLGNLLDALSVILHYVLQGYMWIVIIRALLSWVNPDPYNPIVRALYALTDPVLSRLRRRFPLMAGSIDFSPWVVILVIMFLDRFLVASLAQLALRFR